ncbi:MAG: DASS family sodium-coupled anion symporter [Nitrospirae bacterium]|nr:MAG: DASS family sodium-coupled anion symporter [Nitrospirota bacterium]
MPSKTFGMKQKIGLIAGPLLGMMMYGLPLSSLSEEAKALAAILVWVVVFWISEAIPLPMTALLGAAVCVLVGLGTVKQVFASFAHPIIFLFIGSFFLAEAVVIHALDQRIATWLLSLRWATCSPRRLLFTMGCATALLSMWISNTAAAAIMVPMVLGVLSMLRGVEAEAETSEAGALLLIAYGAAAGGIATMVGTPPNLIGVGLLTEQAHRTLSFLDWLAVGLPIAGVMLVLIYHVLFRLHPLPPTLPLLQEHVRRLQVQLGPWTPGQRNACVALTLAVGLWIFPGLAGAIAGRDHELVVWLNTRLPKELVPIVAAGLLFVLPVNFRTGEFTLSWKQAMNINWGTILLFGGGLTFGHLMVETSLARSIGEGLVTVFGSSTLWNLTAVAIGTALVLTEMASNTAAASMLVPVVIAIAQSANVSPVPPTLGVCLAASLAFVLPVSTPPNAIVYGTGLVPLLSMIRAGLVLDIMGGIVIWLALRILCPVLGLSE